MEETTVEKTPTTRREEKTGKKPKRGAIYFLGAVLLLYLLIWVSNPVLFNSSYATFMEMAGQVLPIVGLVIVIMLVLNMVIPDKFVANYLGRQSGVAGWVIVILAGIIASGPNYLWFQLLQDMKDKGMRTGYIAAFLYAKSIKIFLLPMMIYYFGWIFTIVLTVYMLIFSVVNGYLVEIFAKNSE